MAKAEDTFLINRDSSHDCENKMCKAQSKWYVERCQRAPESYLGPVKYVCSRHLVWALERMERADD